MPSSPQASGFDESKHPRGQPDNPGKFRSRTLPEPPPARRRRPAKEVEPSDEAMALATGLSWDEMVVELGDRTEVGADDGPDPVAEEWEGKTCVACELPMDDPASDVVESLTITTTAGRVLHWHPNCWMNRGLGCPKFVDVSTIGKGRRWRRRLRRALLRGLRTRKALGPMKPTDDTTREFREKARFPKQPSCGDRGHTVDPATETCFQCGLPLTTIKANDDDDWYWELEDNEGTAFERFDAVSRALCDYEKKLADPSLVRCRECATYWFCFTDAGQRWREGTNSDSEAMQKLAAAVNRTSEILGGE